MDTDNYWVRASINDGAKIKKRNEAVGIEVNLEITTDKFWSTRSQKSYITRVYKIVQAFPSNISIYIF